MVGYVSGGLPADRRMHGGDKLLFNGIFTDTGFGISTAQLSYKGEGGIWGWMGAFDDRIVFRHLPLFSDFATGTCCGVSGGNDAARSEEDTTGQGDSFFPVSAFGNGGGGMLLRKTAKGYMTVEASFLITWTMFVFVLLIYLSFYSYDKCVLFQDAYTVCFRGSIQKDENQVVPYIDANMQKQFGKKYFGVGKVQGTVDKDGHTTSVTGECQVKIPIRQVFTMQGKGGWTIRTKAKAQIINPTKMIRICRWVGNVVSN